jgi:uncharacterized protein (DUF2062 family)
LIAFLKDLARIERYRLLRPFHHRAREQALWAFTRDAVARAVAVGFFFGILTPVAQIVFALLGAVVLRANVVVAVASTFITNPFTLPFVYYGAYLIGSSVTGRTRALAQDLAESEQAAGHALEVHHWFATLVDWISHVGYPLLIGVLTLALGTAVIGYLLVHSAWGVARRLRR